jgi:protein-S-isoprenylcysteine O-methyltransferase Ste14
MKGRLSRWGVGPQIAAGALAYAILAGAATHRWPDACRMQFAPYVFFAFLGGILLASGVSMLVLAARSATRACNRDQLVTSGIFGIVRHPIYSAWIVLIVPGLALLARSWPVVLTPLVAYAVFKLTIHQEDEYLEQRFGRAFIDYRRRVNCLIPFAPGKSGSS